MLPCCDLVDNMVTKNTYSTEAVEATAGYISVGISLK